MSAAILSPLPSPSAGKTARKGRPDQQINPSSPPVLAYKEAFLASPTERIRIIRAGIPASIIPLLGADMGVSKEQLFGALDLPRATINRRISSAANLSAECTERVLGLEKIIGQVDVMVAESGLAEDFNAARWVGEWIEQPLPALNGAKPSQYMDTVEGLEMISQLLMMIQGGAYA